MDREKCNTMQNHSVEKITKRGKNKKQRNVSKNSNAGEVLHGSGRWVDPRSGQSASSQSAGHWFTAPDGRKVCCYLHLAYFCWHMALAFGDK